MLNILIYECPSSRNDCQLCHVLVWMKVFPSASVSMHWCRYSFVLVQVCPCSDVNTMITLTNIRFFQVIFVCKHLSHGFVILINILRHSTHMTAHSWLLLGSDSYLVSLLIILSYFNLLSFSFVSETTPFELSPTFYYVFSHDLTQTNSNSVGGGESTAIFAVTLSFLVVTNGIWKHFWLKFILNRLYWYCMHSDCVRQNAILNLAARKLGYLVRNVFNSFSIVTKSFQELPC